MSEPPSPSTASRRNTPLGEKLAPAPPLTSASSRSGDTRAFSRSFRANPAGVRSMETTPTASAVRRRRA